MFIRELFIPEFWFWGALEAIYLTPNFLSVKGKV